MSRAPKVMMVIEATAGGTARHVVEIALGCHRRGLNVHLICSTRRSPTFRGILNELRDAGLTVDELDMRREINPMWDGAAALRLRRLIVSAAPDVLHLHSSKAGGIGRGAVVGMGRRRPAVVYTPHVYAFLSQPRDLRRRGYWHAERALLRLTDRVVAVSASEGMAAARLGARSVVIPNGVDAPRLAPRPPRGRAPLRVGWLGRMVWQKNQEAAVQASFILSRLGVEHEMLIGGDGPEADRLPDAIRRWRAEKQVRVLGFVHDTDAFHAGIDLLLTTSRVEGLPYAGLDAMAHGLPLVGFDTPGIRDLVEHGVTGLLAPPDDTGALAAHVARLARDAELRRAMGVAGWRRVRREFRLTEQIDRLCGLYKSLASRPATSLSDA